MLRSPSALKRPFAQRRAGRGRQRRRPVRGGETDRPRGARLEDEARVRGTRGEGRHSHLQGTPSVIRAHAFEHEALRAHLVVEHLSLLPPHRKELLHRAPSPDYIYGIYGGRLSGSGGPVQDLALTSYRARQPCSPLARYVRDARPGGTGPRPTDEILGP